tara:strand:+ start:464 stop:721 length:258 start_codon:yes stop_codon:yes gene_type:complete
MKLIITKNKKTLITEGNRQYFKYWIKIIDDNDVEIREDEVEVPPTKYLTPDESKFNPQGIVKQTWDGDPEECDTAHCEIVENVIE